MLPSSASKLVEVNVSENSEGKQLLVVSVVEILVGCKHNITIRNRKEVVVVSC